MIRKLLILSLLLLSLSVFSQYTSIPDTNFENALSIYDDIMNDGQIPTANINTVTILDVSNQNISDLFGIQDFTMLQELNCSNNLIEVLLLEGNIQLQWLNISDNILLTAAGIGNNTNIPSTGFFGTNLPNIQCIVVDDINWSVTNWTNIDFDPNNVFTDIAEGCFVVSVNDYSISDFQIFPNPTIDKINITNKGLKIINRIIITNYLGKKVKEYKSSNTINLSNLSNGLFYLNIIDNEGKREIFKIIKN